MLNDYIGKYYRVKVRNVLNQKSEDFLLRLCAEKRINTKTLRSEDYRYWTWRENIIDAIMEEITEDDIDKYLVII